MSTISNIEHHVQSYRSALKSTAPITIKSLSSTHLAMDSILHPQGSNPDTIDTDALTYSLLRLPPQIDRTKKIILGQNPAVFSTAGYAGVSLWPQVKTQARRRTTHFNKKTGTLAVFIASISDIDDLVNLLIAYQTEITKIHTLAKKLYPTSSQFLSAIRSGQACTDLNIDPVSLQKLLQALGSKPNLRLSHFYRQKPHLKIQLLAGSWVDYTKTTQRWWKNIAIATDSSKHKKIHMSRQSIYFVTSNTHSLTNLITGFALKNQAKIIKYIKNKKPELYQTYQQIQAKEIFLPLNDFLYYCLQFFLKSTTRQSSFNKSLTRLHLQNIPSSHYLDINTQIIPVSSLAKSSHLDPLLTISRPQKIKSSPALIFNIDYPLGFTAYHVLKEVLENVTKVKGVYILGKAAVLNSQVGDVQIPRLVFDEHTQNTYMFKNCFNTSFPFTNNQGSVLTKQKSVSVLGTFLENKALLNKYAKNDFTVIEMESGPYLSAITEATYDQSTPKNTIVDLNSAPLDLGIINYTSDTPYNKAKNLGSGQLLLKGVEPVYLGARTILQRIIDLEEQY